MDSGSAKRPRYSILLLQLAIRPGVESIPFKDGNRKIVVFKTEELAKECVVYLDEQNDEKSLAMLAEYGYHASAIINVMKQETWDRFKREQAGRWVYCETLDAFKEVCRSLARRATMVQNPGDFN